MIDGNGFAFNHAKGEKKGYASDYISRWDGQAIKGAYSR